MILPEHVLSKMSAEDRAKLGKAGVTAEEAQRKYMRGQEKDLQRSVSQELFRRGIWFRTSQLNKRTTGKVGEPDFIACVNSRFLGIECKAAGGKLSPEQATELESIRRSGGFTVVAYSLQDVITAINIIQGIE